MFIDSRIVVAFSLGYECLTCYHFLRSNNPRFQELVKLGRQKHFENLQNEITFILYKLETELTKIESQSYQSQLLSVEHQIQIFYSEERIRLFNNYSHKTYEEVAADTPFGRLILEGFYEASESYREAVLMSQTPDSGDM
jgi:hypothetical protein